MAMKGVNNRTVGQYNEDFFCTYLPDIIIILIIIMVYLIKPALLAGFKGDTLIKYI